MAQVGLAVFHHRHRRAHPPQKLEHRQNHADVHRHHQIRDDGEGEGDQQDRDIRARRLPDHAQEAARLAHVPRHQKQDRGQRRQRHLAGIGCQHQQDQQQGDAVDHAGQRRGAAVLDVGGGAGDRTGGGDAAEQR